MTVLIRSAIPEDAPGVAQVHVRSWQSAYENLLPRSYLDRLRPEDRAQHYDFGPTHPDQPSTMVAVEGDMVVGFVTVARARDSDVPRCGEVCALYVDPEWWGRRIGSALSSHGCSWLREQGFSEAILWVLVGNARAERFYDRDGWHRDGLRRTAVVWGIAVDADRYRRPLGDP